MALQEGSSNKPIRLFKSDFLEFFSHVRPVTVLVLWTPVALFFLAQSVWHATGYADAALAAGVRPCRLVHLDPRRVPPAQVLFHYHPKTERFKRLFFLTHGVHHAQPLCRTRLVMPPGNEHPARGHLFRPVPSRVRSSLRDGRSGLRLFLQAL